MDNVELEYEARIFMRDGCAHVHLDMTLLGERLLAFVTRNEDGTWTTHLCNRRGDYVPTDDEAFGTMLRDAAERAIAGRKVIVPFKKKP